MPHERFNVHIVVLVEENGYVHTAYPVAGPGVTRNPDAARDPANPTVADLKENRISFFADSVLTMLGDRLSPRTSRTTARCCGQASGKSWRTSWPHTRPRWT